MLVPLDDNDFNRCKSNIKWLEYSSCGIPAIYSNLTPYNTCIEHMVNGCLVENREEKWYEAIKFFLNNPEVMETIGKKAQSDVKNYYRMTKNASSYLQLFKNVGIGKSQAA